MVKKRLLFGFFVSLCLSVIIASPSFVLAEASNHVIFVSVDGLRPDAVTALGPTEAPNFYRLRTEGAFTDNARNDYDITVTLPTHTTLATGRRILQAEGHNWTSNSDPLPGQTIHSNKGSYVASVFDVLHDNGLSTAMYASKTKFSLFDTSYNEVNGAADLVGVDNGKDKLDKYAYYGDTAAMTDAFVSDITSNLYNYSFLHYTDPDTAGHSSGWNVTPGSNYSNTVKHVDTQLGKLLNLVETNPTLAGHTVIIVTADHGGIGTDHSNASLPEDYTVPFYVWGQNVTSGANLYDLNLSTRLNPGTSRPDYSASTQPIRNGDASNLAISLLGLTTSIPGSGINYNLDLVASGTVAPDTESPIISGVSAVTTSNSATITWTTNEPSTSKVTYGVDIASTEVSSGVYTNSHSITLTGLLPNTTYVYKVSSADAAGNTATQDGYSFTTPVERTVHVSGIALTNKLTTKGKNKFCTVTSNVSILDNSGVSASGASVTGAWSGAYNSAVTGTTNASGVATFTSGQIKNCGTFTFTVNGVNLTGYTYNPALNVTSSATIIAK